MYKFALSLLLASQMACAEVPRLFLEREFTAASFAEAVNHFVASGEDATVQELHNLAIEDIKDIDQRFKVDIRISWMCRVLFEPRIGNLREPAFGTLDLPYQTMPSISWPLYPVVFSGSTYFVLSEFYPLGGVGETPQEYIEYSRMHGTFRKNLVIVPTREQALTDAATLMHSAVWQAIKWKDSGENWEYHLSENLVWTYILQQAKNIPL